LNEYGKVRVTKQILILFVVGEYKDKVLRDVVGEYKDKVLRDVVPMYTTHLLLGHSWQFDRKDKHNGFKNIYSLKKKMEILSYLYYYHRDMFIKIN
jgi:hypothetical protein